MAYFLAKILAKLGVDQTNLVNCFKMVHTFKQVDKIQQNVQVSSKVNLNHTTLNIKLAMTLARFYCARSAQGIYA